MSAAKKTLTGLAVIGLGFGWLVLAPPELLRVGANYSAKIVCSNVFIAGRDADQVMRDDLQALGKPLMRLMRVRVDPEQQTVRAGLLGFIGNGLAVNRPGTGCAAVADGDLARAASVTSQRPAIPAPAADQQWPQGSAAQSVPALQALVANPELAGPGVRGIAVIHNGQLVAEHYGPGFSASTPLLGWSMTKSVTAALVGMQIGDGNLNIAQAGFWPKDSGGREAIQLSNLMAMADGLEFNEGYGNVSDVTRMLYLEPDMAAYMQARPLAHEPGKVWSYSSGTTVLLSHLWQQAAGATALELPYSRLFAPLGMSSAIIEADARGTLVGSSYMYATAQDWARYGQFLLQDGVWQGQRLLPEAYVQTISSPSLVSQGEYAQGQLWRWGPQGSTPEGENPDKRFQLPADTYWMRGHDGQSIAVVPSKQLVVARLGLTPKEQNYQSQGLLSAIIQALP
jgi:CubicO group peptidase (beta-lactamase class C family)